MCQWRENESQPHHFDEGKKSKEACIFLKGHCAGRPGGSLLGHRMVIRRELLGTRTPKAGGWVGLGTAAPDFFLLFPCSKEATAQPINKMS